MKSLPLISLLFFAWASLQAADWPKWLGPDENGISPDAGWLPEIEGMLWEAEVGTGFSSIAVAEGRVYTMGHRDGQEVIWCFDATTGKVLWSHSYPARLLPNLHEGGPAATPTVSEGRVYTLGKDGKAHCLEAQSGKVLWQTDVLALSGLPAPPEWGFAGSPYLHNGQVVLEAGRTVALEAATGKPVWQSEPFRPAYGSPALLRQGADTFILSLKTDGLVALNPAGKTVAFTPWETSFDTNATTPLIAGDRVFVSTGYQRGCALYQFNGQTFTLQYENQAMSNHMNNSVLLDGHLYGFDGTAHRGPSTQFACVELESGVVQWKSGGLGCGSVISAQGFLLILSEKGELILAKASPAGFEPVAREQILRGRCWTPPALANGRVYARNAQGELVCVGLKAR